MKFVRFSPMAVVLLGGLAVSSIAFAAQNSAQPGSSSDKVIASEVEPQVVSAVPSADALSVRASQHIVTLRGFVGSAWGKQHAGEIAGRVPGVQGVRNQLVITHISRGSHQ